MAKRAKKATRVSAADLKKAREDRAYKGPDRRHECILGGRKPVRDHVLGRLSGKTPVIYGAVVEAKRNGDLLWLDQFGCSVRTPGLVLQRDGFFYEENADALKYAKGLYDVPPIIQERVRKRLADRREEARRRREKKCADQ